MNTPNHRPHPQDRPGQQPLQDKTILDHVAAELATSFTDTFSPETVHHTLQQCYDLLAATARVHTHLTVLATRQANQQLAAIAEPHQQSASSTPVVLFVCSHNTGRSQIAATLLNHHARGAATARSAGTTPTHTIDPTIVQAMAELGLDISHQTPQPLTDQAVRDADVVVTMGCGDPCPLHHGTRYHNWQLPDPTGQPIHTVRRIRDNIHTRVRGLLNNLTTTAAADTTARINP